MMRKEMVAYKKCGIKINLVKTETYRQQEEKALLED